MSQLQGAMNVGPVLIVDLSKRYGGADVRVLDLAVALNSRCEYAVATLRDSPVHERLIESGLSALPLKFSRSDPRLLFSLLKIMIRKGFRVVDAHNPQSQFWGLLAAVILRVPVRIATVHSAYGATETGLKKLLYESILRLNASWGCAFIAVSDYVQEYLLGLGIGEDRISMIYNSIHMPEFTSGDRKKTLLGRLGWGNDTYVVTSVGRLEPVKGHRYLIDAMKFVVREHPRVRCMIIGDGRLRGELEERIDRLQLGRWMHLAGFRTDIGDILAVSDAFCLPSLSEGLPFALLEACTFRLPILATEVGGMARFLEDGLTARLLPSRDSGALARAIVQMADNPAQYARMGNAAFELVRERLLPEKMVEETLRVFSGRL